MTGCQCKSGFFTLRDCEDPPIKSCDGCGRMMCTRHTSPASGFTKCLDCWARGDEEKDEEGDEHDDELTAEDSEVALDDEWTYGTRSAFYASGYRPIYSGDDQFDDYDARSFDDAGAGDDWNADEGGGGFGDS